MSFREILLIVLALVAYENHAAKVSENTVLTTDYVYRGISQTDKAFTTQGGFDVSFIQGDTSQLGQVVLNLLTNAAESIGKDEGHINISTKVKNYSKEVPHAIDTQTHLTPGSYINLCITDAGCGISEKTRSKIFDPFFTTKPKGRGLGLAAVQEVVQGHKGMLTVSSVENGRTTFSVILPKATSLKNPDLTTVPSIAVNNANILVVDDDDMVRDVIQRSLTKAGYNVISANDGQEGIDLFRKNPDSIDCVLLNFNMPKLDGEEAYRELSLIRADVKVILCSGYVTQETINRFEGTNLAGILKKPVTRQLLLQKISDVLR